MTTAAAERARLIASLIEKYRAARAEYGVFYIEREDFDALVSAAQSQTLSDLEEPA